jgi:regulator of cell morphogenesis and NO signaling
MSTKTLFVPGLEPAKKHATIFDEFDKLNEAETLLIVNDHDPKPLYFQLIAERGNIFTWDYLQQGPEQWKVALQKFSFGKNETIGTIVAGDIRKAEIFKKFGIDFCCGGKKTVKEACLEKGIEVALIEEELSKPAQISAPVFDFNKWDCDFLADYIYNQHHKYFQNEEPVITELMEKVVSRHGKDSNNLNKIQDLYFKLKDELQKHFSEEETVLFPFIKLVVQISKQPGTVRKANSRSIKGNLKKMESEHEEAGKMLKELSALTNNFTPPVIPATVTNSFTKN